MGKARDFPSRPALRDEGVVPRTRLSLCRGPWCFLLCLWFASAVWASQAAQPKGREPIAVVGGQAIYDEDLLPLIQSQMRQVRQQEYELKSKALESLIQQKLLEAQASKRGLSASALLEQEADAKVSEPSEAEIQAFYMAQKDRINRPLEEVKVQLLQALKQAKLEQTRRAYLENLQAQAEVAVYLRPPKVEVGYDPARVRGDPKASVTIVEFSDFQCPFCVRAYPVVKELLTTYKGRVKLAYRDFPLRQIHAQAQIAAEASQCAGDQGKFWEYHDRLFENQSKLDKPALAGHASTLGLDAKQFDACLTDGKFRAQVEQDLQEGTRAGVNGTPAFFINGVLLSGAQPASAFEQVINAELAALGEKGATQ